MNDHPRPALRIGIVGAGPAGLVAALAARELGFDATLYEQARDFGRVGGGVLLHSNGQRVLDALHLLDSLEPKLRATQRFSVEIPSKGVRSLADLSTLPVPFNRGSVLLRADLQQHLLDAAVARGIAVRFDHRVEAARRDGDGVVLRFAAGAEERFDAVVASDGIHSAVRASLGFRARERRTGEAYLRAVADLRTEDDAVRELWGTDGRKFGICPMPGDRTYFFCPVPRGEWDEVRTTRLDAWIESFAPFGDDVVALLRAVPDYALASYDELGEVELDRWADGPVLVIGDAAHAMTPHIGQGANSAMVDALVAMRLVADELEHGGSVETAGRRYDKARRRFVGKLQSTARQMGSVAAKSGAVSRWLRDSMLAVGARFPGLQKSSLMLAAGYNPDPDEERCLAPSAT